ncbi:hypothetical protein EVAR_15699_1 [Eumeta japonica]|uniref:Uncharacterized protein n=1 Tax=Eumeta variegata TaxID=151549 RepID=A0A4C1U9E6_EUMVA|nr:hypothetical protein EVAR_15699_1 [Eumeta japonica]
MPFPTGASLGSRVTDYFRICFHSGGAHLTSDSVTRRPRPPTRPPRPRTVLTFLSNNHDDKTLRSVLEGVTPDKHLTSAGAECRPAISTGR